MTPIKITRYKDDDLVFLMHVYMDHAWADKALTELRKHFPYATVVLIADGGPAGSVHNLAEKHHCSGRQSGRLFAIERGGDIVLRMLNVFAEYGHAKWCFKIDPDTKVHRRFAWLPLETCTFGTINPPDWKRSIQGGCCGITMSAVRTLLDYRDVWLNVLKDWRFWADDDETLVHRATVKKLVSLDFSLGVACRIASVPIVAYDEVHCAWLEPVDDPRFAVTHKAPWACSEHSLELD